MEEEKLNFATIRMWDWAQATAAIGRGWEGRGVERSRAEMEGGCGTGWET